MSDQEQGDSTSAIHDYFMIWGQSQSLVNLPSRVALYGKNRRREHYVHFELLEDINPTN